MMRSRLPVVREKVYEKRERQNFRCENCPGWSDDEEEVDDSDYDDDGGDLIMRRSWMTVIMMMMVGWMNVILKMCKARSEMLFLLQNNISRIIHMHFSASCKFLNWAIWTRPAFWYSN